MPGSTLIPLALFGFVPLVFVFFSLLPAHRAVLASFFGGWMFLPLATFDLPAVPPWSKVTAMAVPVILGIVVFDSKQLAKLRPST